MTVTVTAYNFAVRYEDLNGKFFVRSKLESLSFLLLKLYFYHADLRLSHHIVFHNSLHKLAYANRTTSWLVVALNGNRPANVRSVVR